jgi:hypothetical protein
MFLHATFHFDELIIHARGMRLIERVTVGGLTPPEEMMPGTVYVMPFLRKHPLLTLGQDQERYPSVMVPPKTVHDTWDVRYTAVGGN